MNLSWNRFPRDLKKTSAQKQDHQWEPKASWVKIALTIDVRRKTNTGWDQIKQNIQSTINNDSLVFPEAHLLYSNSESELPFRNNHDGSWFKLCWPSACATVTLSPLEADIGRTQVQFYLQKETWPEQTRLADSRLQHQYTTRDNGNIVAKFSKQYRSHDKNQTISAFDFKRRFTDWSVYNIKVPRER